MSPSIGRSEEIEGRLGQRERTGTTKAPLPSRPLSQKKAELINLHARGAPRCRNQVKSRRRDEKPKRQYSKPVPTARSQATIVTERGPNRRNLGTHLPPQQNQRKRQRHVCPNQRRLSTKNQQGPRRTRRTTQSRQRVERRGSRALQRYEG